MSKRIQTSAVVALAVLALASTSLAGDFHAGISLKCSDCHVMHYSQTHGYNGNGGGFAVPVGGSGPYHFLLRNDINDLCLTCHDGSSFAPDVFEEHSNGYVRQGGSLNDLDSSGPYYPADGHTLNSTDVAPGSDSAWSNSDGLNCTNCHGAHGAGFANSYRNLGGYGTVGGPGNEITYSRGDVDGANDLNLWVFEDVSGGTNNAHYGVGSITFNEPGGVDSGYANFCKGCHTDFHGAVGGAEIGGVGSPAEEFVRHPAAGADIGAIGGGHSDLARFVGKANQVQVMSPTGQRAGAYDGTDTGLTASCMSCHKGHGNQNAFGLIYMLGTGTIDEEGDDGIDARNMCRQCHGMGGSDPTY